MELTGAGYALGAAALFGASTPAAKLLLRDLSPFMLSALLYLGAAIALSSYRYLRFESREAQITRRDLPPICGIIFFGGMLGPILMLLGLQRLSAVNGSLLLNLEGPFTALIAVGLMREHLGRRQIFAAATIMVGGVVVSFPPGHIGGSWIGAVEIATACLSWASTTISRSAFRYVTLLRLLESRLWALARACSRSLFGREAGHFRERQAWSARVRWVRFVTVSAWFWM